MPKKAWQKQGQLCLFHYATEEAVREIVRTGLYVVSQREHQRHGSGLFLSTIVPGEMTRDAICDFLFLHQRDPSTFSGVLVVRRDEKLLPTKAAGRRACVHRAPPQAQIDLTPVLVGFGVYRGDPGDEWLFSEGCYL